MKVGFAVQSDEGLESKVYNHFGSAPMFVVVETGAAKVQTIQNQDLNHSHGACSPMKALGGRKIDALIVGGSGRCINEAQRHGRQCMPPGPRRSGQSRAAEPEPSPGAFHEQCLPGTPGGCGYRPIKNEDGFPVIK
jgi:hypothetical protein